MHGDAETYQVMINAKLKAMTTSPGAHSAGAGCGSRDLASLQVRSTTVEEVMAMVDPSATPAALALLALLVAVLVAGALTR